jgi:hypothetical protein
LHSLSGSFGQVEKWGLQLCHPCCEGDPGQEYQDQSPQGVQEKGSIDLDSVIRHWSLVMRKTDHNHVTNGH